MKNAVICNGPVLRIGKLAIKLRTTTKTLRHYEKMGLIIPSGRTRNGYRVYDLDDQRRARNVMGLRAIGLSIPEIQKLLLNVSETHSIRQRLLGYLDEKLRETEETLEFSRVAETTCQPVPCRCLTHLPGVVATAFVMHCCVRATVLWRKPNSHPAGSTPKRAGNFAMCHYGA